jgi:hypothetical protein
MTNTITDRDGLEVDAYTFCGSDLGLDTFCPEDCERIVRIEQRASDGYLQQSIYLHKDQAVELAHRIIAAAEAP